MSEGFKNYITPAGHRRLTEELTRLWRVERPAMVSTVAWAASNGDRSENGDYIYGKKRLREIDRRIRYLSKSLDSAVVVDNAGKAQERVFFGATVTYQRESGEEREVRQLAVGWEKVTGNVAVRVAQGLPRLTVIEGVTGRSDFQGIGLERKPESLFAPNIAALRGY